MPCSRTRTIRSSSMQPPDTEPTTVPSAAMASMAPIGRGDEPQVLMTVTSWQRWPASIHAAQALSTSRSILSMSALGVADDLQGAIGGAVGDDVVGFEFFVLEAADHVALAHRFAVVDLGEQ